MNLPLNVLVKENQAPMRPSELPHLRRVEVLELGRPIRPDPDIAIPFVNYLVKRTVEREAVEQHSFFFDVFLELLRARSLRTILFQELAKCKLHEAELDRVNPFVFDVPGVAKLLEPGVHRGALQKRLGRL